MKKNILKFSAFLLMLIIFTSACNKEMKVGEVNISSIKFNETIIVPKSNNMAISFIGVSDKRCPKTQCHLCYGSKASILLSIANSRNGNTEIDLSITGCVDELDSEYTLNYLDTLGYRFKLIKLSPYPDLNTIEDKDYIAKIKITR